MIYYKKETEKIELMTRPGFHQPGFWNVVGALQVSYERGSAVSRDATYFAGVLFHFEVGHPDVPFQHHPVVAPEVTLGTRQTLRRTLILSRDGSCAALEWSKRLGQTRGPPRGTREPENPLKFWSNKNKCVGVIKMRDDQ